MDVKEQCEGCNWYPQCHLKKHSKCFYFENQSIEKSKVNEKEDLYNSTYIRHTQELTNTEVRVVSYQDKEEELLNGSIEDIIKYLNIL